MIVEGEYLVFTITNTFPERRSFYWHLSAISGSISDSDFTESTHSLESWRPKQIDIAAGESKQIKLLIADEKIVEKKDKFKVNVSVSSKNWWDKTLTTHEIEESKFIISDPADQIEIQLQPTDKYEKILVGGSQRNISPDGKNKHIASEFESIYSRINERDIVYVSDTKALIEQYDHNGEPTSFFYATKQSGEEFKKAIQYESLTSLTSYRNPQINDVAFDNQGNAYISHTYYRSSANNSLPRVVSYLSKFDVRGKNLFSTKIQVEGSSYGPSIICDQDGDVVVSTGSHSDINYQRLSSTDGSVMWSSNPYFDLNGGFGRSYNDMQLLGDGTFLATSSGYLEWSEGTSVAKISLEDGSLESWQAIDSDYNYGTNSIFADKSKVYFRTAQDSYLLKGVAPPLNQYSPTILILNQAVKSDVTYSLGSNTKKLILTGSKDISGFGNSLSNTIKGNRADNLLKGVGGRDVLNGHLGNDVIDGGSGTDTAQFSSRKNTIKLNTTKSQNTGDGKDRLISIENVNGGGGNDKITGNKGKNTLNGEKGNDHLYGGGGNDLLIGGVGKDRVWGEGGRDIFRIQSDTGYTIIKDFRNGQDKIHLSSGHSGLKVKTRGNDVLVYLKKDLMAIVEDAAGDLQHHGDYLI